MARSATRHSVPSPNAFPDAGERGCEPSSVGVSARFTPGPWRFDRENDGRGLIWIDRGICNHIAYLSNGGVAEETEEANGHLIAAAPDLLAALKMCVIERAEWLDEARAAIAKAEGRIHEVEPEGSPQHLSSVGEGRQDANEVRSRPTE